MTSRGTKAFALSERLSNAGEPTCDAPQHCAQSIRHHAMIIDKAARAAHKGQKPVTVWFTGLSGAGKSTTANLVEKLLHEKGKHTYLLDGDNVRHGLNRDLGFSDIDRAENVRRVAEVAKLMVDAGLVVLVCLISPFRSERRLARDMMENGEFIEVFIDTPLEECARRDPKGLYKRAFAGEIPNFTGISSPYEAPDSPELHLLTVDNGPFELAFKIVNYLESRNVANSCVNRPGFAGGPNP